jgi:uncharacterized membrane protein
MTPRERAHEAVREHARNLSLGTKTSLVATIEAAIAAAIAVAVAEERERCAGIADQGARACPEYGTVRECKHQRATECVAAAIRSQP